MKKLLIGICLLAGLSSCHSDDEKQEVETKARRTVLIYMAAENNLASYADKDLDEMKTGSISLADDQNLIVYVNRARSTKPPYLARVKNGVLVDTFYMDKGLAADPTVLQKALSYTKQHYQAKSYGLVLWGHASGWLISNKDSISAASRAYGGSTGNGSDSGSGSYWMNIPQMAKAISSALGNERLAFIFGDCCGFACTEVAYELRHVSEYVIGSPAEIPDAGAPFDKTVIDMFNESDNFAERIIQNYFDYYTNVYKTKGNEYYNSSQGDLAGYSVPLVAFKTSALEKLATATAEALTTIADKVSPTGTLNLENVKYYSVYGSYNYSYDMQTVMKRNLDANTFQKWLTVFNEAVPYKLFSQKWMTNFPRLRVDMISNIVDESDCGIASMFFPANNYNSTYPNWNKAIQQYQWNDIIHWEKYGW